MTATREKLSTVPSRAHTREGLQCTWRAACKAADYVLEYFGNPRRDGHAPEGGCEMSTRNDRFNASMRSLDEFMGSFDDPTKIAAFSDMGQGVERMLDEIDHALGRWASCPSVPSTATGETPVAPEPVAPVAPELHKAEMRLYRAGLGYLVNVLRLIVKNGNNRKESIWELAKK